MQLVNSRALYFIVFFEGFVTVSVEILAIRQLMPVLGSNVIVTSIIIGCVLFFLAYGYRRGGQVTDQFAEILWRNFFLAAVLLGFGLASIFVGSFFYVARAYTDTPDILILFVYLLLIVAPLIYLLGQTIPMTMQLFSGNHAGAIGGQVLHLSTLGSFLGAVLTSLFLMNYFGVAATVFIDVLILMIFCGLLILKMQNSHQLIYLLMSLLTLILVYIFNIQAEHKIWLHTNAYHHYQLFNHHRLYDGRQGDVLMMNNSMSSFQDHEKKGFGYIETIKSILFGDMQLSHQNILVLGAGGFTLSNESDFDNQFTYVDVDKDLYNIVSENFSMPKGNFIVGDARQFLQQTRDKYDVIVNDAYSHQQAIPSHLVTYEYFRLVADSLENTGVAIFNVIMKPMMTNRFSHRIHNTITHVFPGCMIIPEKYHHGDSNVIYICPKPDSGDNEIYTDNHNAVMFDVALDNIRRSK